MIFNCVEPAHDNVANHVNFYDWKFMLKRGLGHHVVFPHVDSCLGVICEVLGNRAFAGHINGFYNNDYSAASHRNAFAALVNEIGGVAPNRAIVLGDVATWRANVNIPAQLGCNNITYLITPQANYPNGLDLIFDVDSGAANVMVYQAGRDFRAAVGVRHSENLYAVAGINDANCP